METNFFEASALNYLKSQGIFDQLRHECLIDVDKRPSYQNLVQKVENYTQRFLSSQKWTPDINKNQLRDHLRHYINDLPRIIIGLDYLVEKVVIPKIYHKSRLKIEKEILALKEKIEPIKVKEKLNVHRCIFDGSSKNVQNMSSVESEYKKMDFHRTLKTTNKYKCTRNLLDQFSRLEKDSTDVSYEDNSFDNSRIYCKEPKFHHQTRHYDGNSLECEDISQRYDETSADYDYTFCHEDYQRQVREDHISENDNYYYYGSQKTRMSEHTNNYHPSFKKMSPSHATLRGINELSYKEYPQMTYSQGRQERYCGRYTYPVYSPRHRGSKIYFNRRYSDLRRSLALKYRRNIFYNQRSAFHNATKRDFYSRHKNYGYYNFRNRPYFKVNTRSFHLNAFRSSSNETSSKFEKSYSESPREENNHLPAPKENKEHRRHSSTKSKKLRISSKGLDSIIIKKENNHTPSKSSRMCNSSKFNSGSEREINDRASRKKSKKHSHSSNSREKRKSLSKKAILEERCERPRHATPKATRRTSESSLGSEFMYQLLVKKYNQKDCRKSSSEISFENTSSLSSNDKVRTSRKVVRTKLRRKKRRRDIVESPSSNSSNGLKEKHKKKKRK